MMEQPATPELMEQEHQPEDPQAPKPNDEQLEAVPAEEHSAEEHSAEEHSIDERSSDDSFADQDAARPSEDDASESGVDSGIESGVESDDLVIAEAVRDSPQALETSVALKAVIEAAIYITDEPLTAEQIATATEQPLEDVRAILSQLVREYSAPERGLTVREIAGGYKMSTKAEYHEAIRQFVKRLQPPLKLSLAALETLAVIAYKQPITGPEILEIRGVQGAGVVKTLLDRKLIITAGRKNVLGKPMMYKTSRDFLVQFGLNSLAELPTLKEFEELGRMALNDAEEDAALMAANQTPANEAAVHAELDGPVDDTAEHSGQTSESEQHSDA